MDHKNEIVAILDDQGITEIDSIYVPKHAIRQFNSRTLDQIGKMIKQPLGADVAPQDNPQPFNPAMEQQAVKQNLAPLGNKRFFKPDELDEKTWQDSLKDLEWTAVVEVTSEMQDKTAVLANLTSAFQTVSAIAQQGRTMTPDERMIFSALLTETGRISPLQLQNVGAQAPPGGGMMGGAPPSPTQALPAAA